MSDGVTIIKVFAMDPQTRTYHEQFMRQALDMVNQRPDCYCIYIYILNLILIPADAASKRLDSLYGATKPLWDVSLYATVRLLEGG